MRLEERGDPESMFRYARQLDRRVLVVQGQEGLMVGHGEPISNVIKIYTKGTRIGAQHLHHCLPRIISIWLDFSATGKFQTIELFFSALFNMIVICFLMPASTISRT